jgi:hypothetical protein
MLSGNGSLTRFIDVLMVWHAYMLNPRTYLEDCMRFSKRDLWNTPFPWWSLFDMIDSGTFIYEPPAAVIQSYETWTGDSWNPNYDDDADATTTIDCPRCFKRLEVRWTIPPKGVEARQASAVHNPAAAPLDDSTAMDVPTFYDFLERDKGYAAKAFWHRCPKCNLIITHESLCAAKLIYDCDLVRSSSRPLPGTILGLNGTPQVTAPNKKLGNHDLFFPNRIANWEGFRFSWQENPHLCMNDIKIAVEKIMASPSSLSVINKDQFRPDVTKLSRNSVRRWLSHYWDNSSMFGIDLVGAVMRQGSFVQKMHKIDWYHSPAVVNSMERFIRKYHRFIRLMAENPKRTAVPTLDVDLAWVSSISSPNDSLSPFTCIFGIILSQKKKKDT